MTGNNLFIYELSLRIAGIDSPFALIGAENYFSSDG